MGEERKETDNNVGFRFTEKLSFLAETFSESLLNWFR